jgi:hypothetical protein
MGSRRQLGLCVLILTAALNGWLAMVFNGLNGLSGDNVARHIEAHLQQHLLDIGLMLVSLSFALCLCLSIRNSLPRAAFLAILLVNQLDLLSTNVANFQLVSPKLSSPVPTDEQTKGRLKYIESPFDSRRFRSDAIRYSKSVPLAIEQELVLIGTNEGGVLPQATESLFHAVEINPKISLQFIGCDYLFVSRTGQWVPIKGGLPDVFFLPSAVISDLDTPLSSLSEEQLQNISEQLRTDCFCIISQTTHSICLSLDTNESGLLVVSQTSYPGWECKINGTQCDIDSVCGVFCAFSVPKGASEIRLEYRPGIFYWGLCFCCLGMGLSATVVFSERIKMKKE